MNTTFINISSICLINGAMILAGCTSSDSSSGGGSTAVPANAVTITSSNAKKHRH